MDAFTECRTSETCCVPGENGQNGGIGRLEIPERQTGDLTGGGQMEMDMNLFITAVGLGISVAAFFIGRTTAAKQSGIVDGETKANIEHIKNAQEDLREDVRQYGVNYTEVRAELEKIKGRVAKLEEIIRIYHEGSIV